MYKQTKHPRRNRLPLNPFERYMLQDDHPEFPMVIRVRLALDKRIDRDRLARALDATLQLHPLMRSIVVQQGGVTCWENVCPAADSGENVLTEHGQEQPVTRLSLRESKGFRVQLVNDRRKKNQPSCSTFITRVATDWGRSGLLNS